MNLAAIPLAVAIAGMSLSALPSLAADPAPAATAQYGEPRASGPAAGEVPGQAQQAPRRKPSPPVAGQSGRGPAFKEECVWVGKRIVNLLSRDDAMAANDFMPFYGHFGCPPDHLAKSFGCVVTNTDPSENEALADRIDACWDDPKGELPKAPSAAAEKIDDEQPKERPTPPGR